jgi:hypothetical protein
VAPLIKPGKLFKQTEPALDTPQYFPKILDVLQNPNENDLDCTILFGDGSQCLMDLMEFAPLGIFKDYANVPRSISVGQIADYLHAEIMKKAIKYQSIKRPWLLCYATDFRLAIGPHVHELLESSLRESRGSLERIMFLTVLEDTAGGVTPIYPTNRALEFINIEQTRSMIQEIEDMNFQSLVSGNNIFIGPSNITYLP